MTNNYHTAIATGAAANAATFNSPLGQLDLALTTANTDIAARVKKYTGKTTAPTVNNDSGGGYAIGDVWVDETNDRVYWCNDNALGAALWLEIGNKNKSTVIDGLTLIWNSATSVSVGTGSCYAENGDFINVTSAIVKSSLSLAINTWYHLYVYLSAGAAAAEVVTTAPAAWKGTAYSKTGDTSRRYVGSIRSDASGNVLKFVQYGSQIKYVDVINGSTVYRVLNNGSATVSTAVSLSSIVPVTAGLVDIMVINNGTPSLDIYNAASQWIFRVLTLTRLFMQTYHESQTIYYINSSTGGSAVIDVFGYTLLR